MITVADYFGPKEGHPEATEQMHENAALLLGRVNDLLDEARECGAYNDPVDPDTGTCISGSRGGSGDGGFRFHNSATGAPKSAHKQARGVDVYDPTNRLDTWITDEVLERFGLHREHPDATPGWCHLQDVPPGSGRRTFRP